MDKVERNRLAMQAARAAALAGRDPAAAAAAVGSSQSSSDGVERAIEDLISKVRPRTGPARHEVERSAVDFTTRKPTHDAEVIDCPTARAEEAWKQAAERSAAGCRARLDLAAGLPEPAVRTWVTNGETGASVHIVHQAVCDAIAGLGGRYVSQTETPMVGPSRVSADMQLYGTWVEVGSKPMNERHAAVIYLDYRRNVVEPGLQVPAESAAVAALSDLVARVELECTKFKVQLVNARMLRWAQFLDGGRDCAPA